MDAELYRYEVWGIRCEKCNTLNFFDGTEDGVSAVCCYNCAVVNVLDLEWVAEFSDEIDDAVIGRKTIDEESDD